MWARLNLAEPGATVAVDSEARFFIPDGLRVTGPTFTVRESARLGTGSRSCPDTVCKCPETSRPR